jgi:hypothetical protein
MERRADEGNWQARGQEFSVGQSVQLVNGGATDVGRVVATYPGIGMCDVQFPHTSYRIPVEDLQIINPGDDPFIAPMHEDVPGGAGSEGELPVGAPASNVIEGEVPRVELVHEVGKTASEMSHRVAQAFVKKSLYWHGRDRKYRVSREEHATGNYRCPAKCCDGTLRRASYKMEDGRMVKLHACPSCLFMIRSADILDDHCAPAEGAC